VVEVRRLTARTGWAATAGGAGSSGFLTSGPGPDGVGERPAGELAGGPRERRAGCARPWVARRQRPRSLPRGMLNAATAVHHM